jgi:hypothetical protein
MAIEPTALALRNQQRATSREQGDQTGSYDSP